MKTSAGIQASETGARCLLLEDEIRREPLTKFCSGALDWSRGIDAGGIWSNSRTHRTVVISHRHSLGIHACSVNNNIAPESLEFVKTFLIK